MFNQIGNLSYCGISSLLFSLNAKCTLYFFNDFKNTPKASEPTSVVVKYAFCGNLLVVVGDLDFMLW